MYLWKDASSLSSFSYLYRWLRMTQSVVVAGGCGDSEGCPEIRRKSWTRGVREGTRRGVSSKIHRIYVLGTMSTVTNFNTTTFHIILKPIQCFRYHLTSKYTLNTEITYTFHWKMLRKQKWRHDSRETATVVVYIGGPHNGDFRLTAMFKLLM